MKYKLTFTEPVLGTWAGDPQLAGEFIASKNPDGPAKDEEKTIEEFDLAEQLIKGSTVFPKLNGIPFFWDYQFKGFFKESCYQMVFSNTMTMAELKKFRLTPYLYKRTIASQIFVLPRKIMIHGAPETLEFCERPLRGETMKGERICLARSEMCPTGVTCEIEVVCLNKKLEAFIPQWLKYGELKGMLQWRNSGMGRFSTEEIAE
jgi:hypothetical protein